MYAPRITSNFLDSLKAGAMQSAEPPMEGRPYGRCPLLSTDEFEIMVACWRPGGFCAPHDHGNSRGLVFLLEGRFIERTWGFRGGILRLLSQRCVDAPAVVEVDEGLIHDMGTMSGGLSLHLYAPTIETFRVFDVQNRETLLLRGGGAWLSPDAEMVLQRSAWSEAEGGAA